jgi:DNA-binding MarR family transcriptional regulator
MNETTAVPAGLLTLLHAAQSAHGHVEAKLSAIGLSLPKLAALGALHGAGESMPLSQLAQRLACVKSNITQLVDRLEADGLVSRAHDPNDRRTRLAVMTPAGRAAFEQGILIHTECEKELFGGLSAEESDQFSALIAKITSRTG